MTDNLDQAPQDPFARITTEAMRCKEATAAKMAEIVRASSEALTRSRHAPPEETP